MSYIEPNTDIYLLEGVPLDPEYENTIYFPLELAGGTAEFNKQNYDNASYADIKRSRDAQANYFLNHYSHFNFTQQTYQRVNRNTIRLHKNAESLLRVNYVMFRNTNFQDTGEGSANEKWFYGFVTSVDYINNSVCQISYNIDVMQTWWFDCYPNRCFVEREHTMSDELFAYIEEEDIECGDEYVCNSHSAFDMNSQSVIILTNRAPQGAQPATSIDMNNIYTPVRVVGMVAPTDLGILDTLLDNYNENDIITIYQCPTLFCPDVLPAPGSIITPITRQFGVQPVFNSLDGYVPKNKKLFCYPYNCIVASNNSGETQTYRWEDWSDGFRGNFELLGVAFTNPSVTCYPTTYRGLAQDYDNSITYNNFPMCAWAGNTFKDWWSQNKNSFVVSALTGIGQTAGYNYFVGAGKKTWDATGFSNFAHTAGGGITSGRNADFGGTATLFTSQLGATTYNPAMIPMAAANLLGEVTGAIARYNDIKNAPNKTHGQVKFDSLNAGAGRLRFDFYCMSIKRQYARMVDDFFSRFGYSIKRLKEPNRLARREWTYTKTIGCTLNTAKLPADDEAKISSIYDNGITFWNNPDHIGDYSLDNSPRNVG